ncbi:MAG: phosphoribosylamine--glycine ligase, partial [Synergistaceae bacterium]|nr:phosphoribosylamine--glycine ligase [Synergistaceae bacterium]
FGDPEAEAVLPLLATDLFSVMLAVREERLSDVDVKFIDGASCCVVLASGGYPGICLTGYPIDFGGAEVRAGVEVYHCGTKFTGTQYVTNGGRVLAVTGIGATPEEARGRAYDSVSLVKFEGMRYRTDIGAMPE